jgi:hypothetical protein
MRKLLTWAALAAGLAACGSDGALGGSGIDDRTDEPSPLDQVRGTVTNPRSLPADGDLRLALVWYPGKTVLEGELGKPFGPSLFYVSEDVPITTSFPTNFTLSLTSPPPSEAVVSDVSVPPDGAQGQGPEWPTVAANNANAVLVLYDDRNGNGRLDLVDIDIEGLGEFVDDVVGMAKSTQITWFEGPLPGTLTYPASTGQPSAGFNLAFSADDVIQIGPDANATGSTSFFGLTMPFAWQPSDAPVTIELSDDPVLDLVMCRKNIIGCRRKLGLLTP